MTRRDGHPDEPVRLAAHVAAADRVARVLVGGFDLCAEAGRPLSALQQVELIKAALLELDGPDAAPGVGGFAVERVLARNGH
jgi:hypothetical protein